MKIVTMMSGVITLILMLSAMICGLWLKSGQPGSIDFHIGCGIASVVFLLYYFDTIGDYATAYEERKINHVNTDFILD